MGKNNLDSKRLYLLRKTENKLENTARTSDKMESELIKLIISLQFPPGIMINENEITEQLKCGRTPLREALLRLSQENLIVSIPRRGMFVAELDLMNYIKLIEAVGLLESFSAFLAVEQCSNDEIDELEVIMIKAKSAFEKKEILSVVEFDFEFHIRIAEFTRNEYIVQATARLQRLLSRYFYIALKNGLDASISNEEHLRIIKAFRRRNSEEVKNFMYLHTMETRDRISATLLNSGRPVFPTQIKTEVATNNNTIRIGVPTMMTGPGAPMGADILAGISKAVQNVNKTGGVLGKKLEIVYADIKDTNQEDSRLGGQLLSNANVAAFFPGGFFDPACAIEFAQYQQPFLHASALKEAVDPIAENLDAFGNVFQLCASEENLGPNAFTNLVTLPYKYPNKKIAMLGSSLSYDMHLQKEIGRYAQRNDWEIILNDSYPFGSTRFDAQLARIRAEKPAIIFGSITSTESAIEFINQFLQNPTDSLIFLQWSPGASKFINLLKKKANGILWQTEFGYLPTKENIQWVNEFTNEFGREPGVAWPAMMDDMLNIWINAVEYAGDPNDYKSVNAYIRNLNQHPYNGRTGRYGINPERNEGLSGLNWLPIHTYQIQNMKNILLFLDTDPFKGNEIVSQGKFIIPPWIQGTNLQK